MAKYSRSELVKYIANNLSKADLPNKTAAFLIDNNKASELDSIMRDVNELRKKNQATSEVTVKTAHPLTPEIRRQIEYTIKSQFPDVNQVILHEVIDQKIIGGIVLEFANEVIDASVRGKLNKLKEAIL